MTPLEVLAVLFSLISVYLTVKEHIGCWPLGLIGVTLYAVVFFQARLYANMGLQAVFAALSLYGWYHWLHGGREQGALSVARVALPAAARLAVLGVALSALLGIGFARFTDASAPYLDSTLAAFSVLAQWMLSRKLLESWLVWIAVDIASVGLFFSQRLYLTTALYAVFLVLATQGYIAWRRSASAAAAA